MPPHRRRPCVPWWHRSSARIPGACSTAFHPVLRWLRDPASRRRTMRPALLTTRGTSCLLRAYPSPHAPSGKEGADKARCCGNRRERILRHEAAHFLVGYLLGVPVTGYSLDLGKEHTDFVEAKLAKRIIEGRLSDKELDLLAVVRGRPWSVCRGQSPSHLAQRCGTAVARTARPGDACERPAGSSRP